MGIACKINRNSNGAPTSVVLETGEKSKLFQDALDVVKDSYAALEVYATSLTETFKEEVLDPLRASKKMGSFDKNGEPKLEVVTRFITAKNWEDKKLDSGQTRDIKKALQTIPDFRGKLAAAFYSKGIFSIDRANMVSSGLYSVAEVNNILNSPELQNRIRSTVEGFMNTSEEQLGVKFQIGGETGAKRLDALDESTHRMDNLETARDMEAKGEDIISIRAATGWEKGTDGKWRYEVEYDAVVSDNFDLANAFRTKEAVGLADLIGKDNKLLSMYPALSKIKVIFTDSFIEDGQEQLAENSEGFYNNESQHIVFNSRNMSAKDVARINTTLIHEVQHAIQYSEGFAVGGNLSTMFNNEGLVDQRGYLDRYAVMLFIEKKRLELEQRAEKLKRAVGSENVTKELLEETGNLEEGIFISSEIQALQQWSRFPQSEAYASRYYYKLAGEAEARTAQGREGWSENNRRYIPLSSTSDIAIEDQIVMFDRKGSNNNFNYSLDTSLGLDTKALFRPIMDRLALSGLAAEVKIVNSEEVKEILRTRANNIHLNLEYYKNAKGFVLDGSVYLNSDNMTLDTPIHEFGHLWTKWAFTNKPALYARGIELIKSSGQRYIKSVEESQPNLVGDLVYEEALVEAIGDQGAKFILANEKKDYKSWIESLWNVLKSALGLSSISNDRISNMSLEEFSQAVAIDLMNGTNMPFKTRKYTIQPLLDKMLANKQGKMVSTQTIMQIVKQKGTKKIEKDIIEEILALPAFKGKGKIPFNQFEAEVQDKLMELTVIESTTYNSYGSNITGMHFDMQRTHIFNSGLDHGKRGHFNSDFGGQAPKKFEVRELQNNFVVVDADATLTQANVQDNVYHAASTREEAEEWVANFTRNGKINTGLFGHTRVWYSGETAYLAELQSDSYQKAKAEEMLLDSYRRDPSTMNTKQRELMEKYDKGIKTIANASASTTLMSNRISEVMSMLSKRKERVRLIEEHNGETPTERGLLELENNKNMVAEEEAIQKALFSIAATGKVPTELPSYKTESGDLVYTDLAGYNKLEQRGEGWVLKKGFTTDVLDTEEFESMKTAMLDRVKAEYSNFPVKEYEAYFYAQKDIPKISAQITKAASIQDQQWIAHRKNYTERLLREEIRISAERGYKTLSIPTPRTLALIEGYSSESDGGENTMPYETYNDSMDDLREGDTIEYDGYTHVVIEADSHNITVVDQEYYHSEDSGELAYNEAEYFIGEEMTEFDDHYGKLITEEEWDDIDKPWFAENLDFEDVTEHDEDTDTYVLDEEKLKEAAKENFIESFDAYEEISNRGGSNITENYGTISYVLDGASTETFMQPDQYEEVASEEDFDIDNYPEDQQTVLRKYEELVELFKKERGENTFESKDNRDNGWVSTSLTPEDGVQPVILFQMPRIEQKPLTEFFKGDKDTDKVSSIGTYESKNPHVLEKEAVQELGGIKDRAEFEEKLQSSGFETLKIKYNQDQIFAEGFFKRMSSLSRVREFKIDESGLTRKNTVDTAELFEETLTISDLKISEQIAFLEGIPSDIWRNNPKEITIILEGVRKMAVDMGLNLKNLEDYYTERSQDELINLLVAVKNVNLQPNKSRLSELTEAYDKFFETEKQRSVQVTTVPESHKDKSLIYLDTNIGEYEIFEKYSLIKVRGNLYQKVKKEGDIEALYEQLVAAESAGTVIAGKPESTEKKKSRIKESIEERASKLAVQGAKGEELLKMAAYQQHFGTERVSQEEVNTTNELTKYSNFTGDMGYLTGEFVADFNKASIKAEQGVGKAYEEFYSNFEVSAKGIVLKNTDEITMEVIRDYVEGGTLGKIGEDLKQYSIISKESGLDIIGEAESKIKTDEFYRDFYVNNPEQAPKVSTYTNVDTGVIAAKGAPKFIMTNKGLFEAVSELGNVGFYVKLPSSSKYNQMNVEQPELTIDVSEYSHLQSIPKSSTRVSNRLTKAEEQRINNEQFNC